MWPSSEHERGFIKYENEDVMGAQAELLLFCWLWDQMKQKSGSSDYELQQ